MSTADVIDESLTAMEQTMDVLEGSTCLLTPKQHAVRLVVFGAAAGAIGGVAAYFIGNRQLKAKYEKIAEAEIAQAKEFYRALNKKDDFSTPEKTVGKLIPASDEEVEQTVNEAANALRSYQGEDPEGEEIEVEVEEVTTNVNVFLDSTPADDDWDIEEEMKTRTPDAPYIISSEEFMLNEPEHSQTTITYYEGDGTLADERDQEIPFVDPVVGEENLYHFGRGSGDNRLVYIRNERLSADFEVVKSDGKYAHEVLGLQHSDGGDRGRRQRNAPRKYRGEDG